MIASTISVRQAAKQAARQAVQSRRALATVSQSTQAASSSSSSSSSSSWKPPIKPGVEPAYDEAVKYIAEQQAANAQKAHELEEERAKSCATGNERIALDARINSYLVASQINDPQVRWRFENDPSISLGEPVFAHLREKVWRSQQLPKTVERIQLMKVLPDAVATLNPLADVQVFFGQGSGIHDHGGEGGAVQVGCFVEASKTVDAPVISATPFHADERLYTLALVDLDAPYEAKDRLGAFALWLMHNVPLSLTQTVVQPTAENVTLPYIAPHPQRGTPYHRYALVLLEQTNGSINVGAVRTALEGKEIQREHFSIQSFAQQHDLRSVGIHFWRAIWSPASADAISQIYATSLQRPEPHFQ